MRALSKNTSPMIRFDTDSFGLALDCVASSTATPFASDHVKGTCKKLSGITMSGIASGLPVEGIGSVMCKIIDDSENPLDLQTDNVLHLKDLPTRLVSPKRLLKQHHAKGDGCNLHDNESKLALNGCTKTTPCDPMSNLPMLHTESGVSKLHNLMQDGDPNENLTSSQRQLSRWHKRLAHMGTKRVNDFARKGFLPKEIPSCKTPSCPFCIQVKQQRDSVPKAATGGSIKEGDIKPGMKVSCDQCQ